MRYKLIISYDGSKFFGFQRQKNQETIQNTIEKALTESFGENITIHGAGRTDTGVHALGQVIDFKISKNIPLYNLKKVLNKRLHPYIHIINAEIVDDTFHSRIDATKKEYHYIISTDDYNPTKSDYIYYVDKNIDIELIKKALPLFIGIHDFKGLSKLTPDKSTIKNILKFELLENNNEFTFIIIGDGFLRNMVRVIIAVLIRLGLHQLSLDDIKDIIEINNRAKAPWIAPASGLYLYKVYYKDTE